MKYMIGQVITTGAIVELAHLAGLNVNMNSNSTDFLKIQVGKSTIDQSGGSAIYLRLLSRLITGKMTSAAGITSTLGGRYGAPTRLDRSRGAFGHNNYLAASGRSSR